MNVEGDGVLPRAIAVFPLATALAVLAALPSVLAAAAAAPRPAQEKPGRAKQGEAAEFADLKIDDDVKDVPAKDLRAGGDDRKRYFLIPTREKRPPAAGCALLVVLPGGTGEASFHNFVRRIWKNAAPDDWAVAQLVSVRWRPDQQIIWPTRFSRVPGQEFTTEEYFAAVVEDVRKVQKLKIDPARIYQMGWSSGGPAEYAIALQEKRPVTGSYVAMSVFHDNDLANDLEHARSQAFFLDHSPEDTQCRFEFAEKAKERLTKAGAVVELVTYKGGHGWSDQPFVRMKRGFAWLDEHHGRPAR
jgi:predicted esterase